MSKSSKKQTDTSNQAMPIIPKEWQDSFNGFLGSVQDMTKQPALNSSQTTARDYFNGNLSPTQYTLGPAQQVTAQKSTPYLWNAQTVDTNVDPYATSDVQYDPFAASKGSEFMKDYQNPYTSDVVDTSLADYDTQAARDLASRQAARGAGSAFGTGADTSDALYSADSARGRASLDAGLRSTAFNTAAGYGMSDADRFTQAAATNAANKLAASEFNAGAKNTAASTAFGVNAASRTRNANAIDAASMDNVHNYATADAANADRALSADTGNANRNLTVDQGNADLFNANRAFGQSNAGAIAAMGQTENQQQMAPWELLLRALQTGTSQFGTSSTGTNTETKTPGLFDWLSLASGIATGLAKRGAGA